MSIYFIYNKGNPSFIKIGSSKNLNKRLRDHAGSIFLGRGELFYIEIPHYTNDRDIHKLFKKFQVSNLNTEVFHSNKEILLFAQNLKYISNKLEKLSFIDLFKKYSSFDFDSNKSMYDHILYGMCEELITLSILCVTNNLSFSEVRSTDLNSLDKSVLCVINNLSFSELHNPDKISSAIAKKAVKMAMDEYNSDSKSEIYFKSFISTYLNHYYKHDEDDDNHLIKRFKKSRHILWNKFLEKNSLKGRRITNPNKLAWLKNNGFSPDTFSQLRIDNYNEYLKQAFYMELEIKIPSITRAECEKHFYHHQMILNRK